MCNLCTHLLQVLALLAVTSHHRYTARCHFCLSQDDWYLLAKKNTTTSCLPQPVRQVFAVFDRHHPVSHSDLINYGIVAHCHVEFIVIYLSVKSNIYFVIHLESPITSQLHALCANFFWIRRLSRFRVTGFTFGFGFALVRCVLSVMCQLDARRLSVDCHCSCQCRAASGTSRRRCVRLSIGVRCDKLFEVTTV